jgi:hypothetical protein
MTLRRPRNQPIRSASAWKLGAAAVILILAAASSIRFFSGTEKPVNLLIDFHQYHYGAVPEEFDYDATGSHGPVLSAGRPFWRVYLDRFAPSPELVLIQAASLAEPDHYPIALLRDVQAKDMTLSVYLKPMGGTMDQSQGLLWRAQDKDNYYAVLASASDSQLRLFKMVDGQPQEISSAPIQIVVQFEEDAPSPTWGWYALKVETDGGHITVWFEGDKKIEAIDKTFMRAGQVGLITHADSVTLFDDLSMEAGNRK